MNMGSYGEILVSAMGVSSFISDPSHGRQQVLSERCTRGLDRVRVLEAFGRARREYWTWRFGLTKQAMESSKSIGRDGTGKIVPAQACRAIGEHLESDASEQT
jgi:hypothetical protein